MNTTWHLRNVDVFAELSSEDRRLVSDIFRNARYGRGELLYLIDEPAERLFFLGEGIVKLAFVTREGDEKVIDIFQPGDVFGQMFLSETRRYAFQAEALEDVAVATLSQEGFKELMQACPDICLKLVRHMVEHHRHTMEMLEMMMRTDASHRLLHVLLSLGERQGRAGDAVYRLHASLTQDDLANMTGLNRTTVSLLINDFRREGILGGQGCEILVYQECVKDELGGVFSELAL